MTSLAAIIAASFVLRLALGWLAVGPWVVPDELIYSEMARSISEGHVPAIRGVATRSYGPLYPLVLAPAWAASTSQHAAYTIALAINALVMSLAALPAYLLARRFLEARVSLLIAALSVLVPSLAYTGVLMTENLFYPACLLVMLGVARVLERPTPYRQFAVVSLIIGAFLVRQQAVVFIVAYLGSIALYAVFVGGGWFARLRPFLPSLIALAAVLLAGVTYGLATNRGAFGSLGTYATAPGGVDAESLPEWIVYHLADLTLYLGAIPVAASGIAVWLAARRRTPRLQIYAALTVSFVTVATLTAAAVSSQVGVGSHDVLSERNMFFVAPLFLIGLALWIDEGFVRPRRLALILAGALLLMVLLLPIGRFAVNSHFQALGIVPWIVLPFNGWLTRALAVSVCFVLLVLWLRCPSSRPDRLWVAVGATFLVTGTFVVAAMAASSRESLRLGIRADKEWIDSVTGGKEVVVLWRETSTDLAPKERGDPRIVWLNEFFNRDVGAVYSLGRSLPYGFPETHVTTDSDGAVRLPTGARLRADYVLALCELGVRGRVVAADKGTTARVIRVGGPVTIGKSGDCSTRTSPIKPA